MKSSVVIVTGRTGYWASHSAAIRPRRIHRHRERRREPGRYRARLDERRCVWGGRPRRHHGPRRPASLYQAADQSGQPVVGVVNNAFGDVRAPFLELTENDWQKTLTLTLMSAVNTARTCLPLMQRHQAGSIVNIASVCAMGSGLGMAPYEAAKAALNALTRSLAVEFGPEGIRVARDGIGAPVTVVAIEDDESMAE